MIKLLHVFLINSFSLKDKSKLISSIIEEYCINNNIKYKLEINSNIYSTEKILSKYKTNKAIIICIGGDGTINRTLNSLIGTDNILGYIPLGTGNDFYKSNRELLKSGINDIDLVKINDKYFINIACFGVDADIANNENLIHSKIIPKSQRYNVSIVKNFLAYKARWMRVLVNGEVYEDEFTTVAVCNGRYYGGGYKIGTNAHLDDGLLDIYLASKTNKVNMAKLLLQMKDGGHEKSNIIRVLKAKSLVISSTNNIKCNIDGEVLEANKFNIELVPKGIKIYYNEDLISNILEKYSKIEKVR